MYLLLYADDTILLAQSSDELQMALNGLQEYCIKWKLKVNISKTKIVIFSRGKVRRYPEFHFGDQKLDVCDDYIYLGVTFNYNGLFNKAIEKQLNQAKRAMYALMAKLKRLDFPQIYSELFDKCVIPVLLYECEVWGWCDIKQLETFQRNFIRMILENL